MPRGFRGGERRTIALERLIARDGDQCWYCGGHFVPRKRSRTIDHVVPLALGGRNRLDNLRFACAQCNHAKGSLTGHAYAASPYLAQRRRLINREQHRILGALLPKAAYHHPRIEWFGEGRWACRSCHVSSLTGTRSPSAVPCRPPSRWLAVQTGLSSLSNVR